MIDTPENSKQQGNIKQNVINTGLGRKPVLPYNLQQFVSYCLKMQRKFLGLTRSIKRMAFKLATKNCLADPCLLQQGTAQAGSVCLTPCVAILDWRLRQLQVTLAARVQGFKKINFAIFFPEIRANAAAD